MFLRPRLRGGLCGFSGRGNCCARGGRAVRGIAPWLLTPAMDCTRLISFATASTLSACTVSGPCCCRASFSCSSRACNLCSASLHAAARPDSCSVPCRCISIAAMSSVTSSLAIRVLMPIALRIFPSERAQTLRWHPVPGCGALLAPRAAASEFRACAHALVRRRQPRAAGLGLGRAAAAKPPAPNHTINSNLSSIAAFDQGQAWCDQSTPVGASLCPEGNPLCELAHAEFASKLAPTGSPNDWLVKPIPI